MKKHAPETAYKLSRVANGLWTVKGMYSTAEPDPADFFKPSPLYAPSEEKSRPLRAGRLRLRRVRTKAQRMGKVRAGRGSVLTSKAPTPRTR